MGQRFFVVGVMFGIVALVVILWTHKTSLDPLAPKVLLNLKSEQLQKTLIVPTMNSPIPEGKSAIWCASFQIAWDEMKTKVVQEPIRIPGVQEIADRLNNSAFPPKALNPGMYYANAGLTKDGIGEKIHKDMKERFPNVTTPKFEGENIQAVAYAYLEAILKFPHPYIEEPVEFTDSQGQKSKVRAFGIHQKSGREIKSELSDQLNLLYIEGDEETYYNPEGFALDLSEDSKDYQIVVARIPKQLSLEETFTYLQKCIKNDRTPHFRKEFRSTDEFLVPMMHFKIEHQFRELEHKPIENAVLKGTWFDPAYQMIHFQIDETGAILRSEARLVAKGGMSKRLFLNQPYLLYMKKRDADLPFFMMWIDNNELMMKMD